MQRVAIVLVVASLVVVAFIALDRGSTRLGAPLPSSVGLDREAAEAALRKTVAGAATRGAAMSPPVAIRAFDIPRELASKGPVGEALRAIISKTHGSDPSTMDRSFARDDIYRILEAWRADPERRDADIDFFVELWNEYDDAGFRYAMSFLFRYAKDDRLVEPLMDLVPVHPWQAVDALAAIGTPHAFEHLALADAALPRPEDRAQAALRLAGSSWEGALKHLQTMWEDPKRSDVERFVAVEALGRRPDDAAATRLAFEIASGLPQPLVDLGERNREYEVKDLRAAAVTALMHAGDGALVRRLVDAADRPDAQPDLASFIDRAIGAFSGGDLSRFLLDRIDRRGMVSVGEAHYLAQHARLADLPQLERLRALCVDATARQILDGAIQASMGR
ncbi:MAG TPA: hypothetical protein PKA37_08685 [Planctomycetota bacterium]|nr:hypothetical protein [Planctomycetota bacterium]